MKYGKQRPYATDWHERRLKHDLESARGGRAVTIRLALAIREARRAACLTQAKLAERIGVSRSVLAQWETAARGIPMLHVPDLRKALPVAEAWKIEGHWSVHHGQVAGLVEGP